MSELSESRAKRLRRRKRRRIIKRVLAVVSVCALLSLALVLILGGSHKSSEKNKVKDSGTVVASENVPTMTKPIEQTSTEAAVSPSEEPSSVSDDVQLEITDSYEDPRMSAIDQFQNPGTISSETTFVNIRRGPSTDSDIIGKAMVYSVFNILDNDGEWAHIEAEGKDGYISAHFVLSGDSAIQTALEHCNINAFSELNKVKAYQSPDENSGIVFRMFAENGYEVIDLGDEWVQIRTNENEIGYVKRENLNIRYSNVTPFFFEEGEALSELRRNILDYAFEWYGGAYVWGGLTLGVGVDCSGYCLRVYEHFNINLPRLSADQAQWGKAVASIDEARPGDLLFFRGFYDTGALSEGVGHVGIYIGNHKMIHAASHERGITVDTYNYLEEPLCIRRVIND